MIFIAENIPDYLPRLACGELPCKDCGVNTHRHRGIREYYMVTTQVWCEAHKPNKPEAGFLCIGCLEKRLGRELNAQDFDPAPINYIFTQSIRLKDRVLRGITPEQLEYAKDIIVNEIARMYDDMAKIDQLAKECPDDRLNDRQVLKGRVS